jgi:ABC-type sugar transport system permease subunit
MRSTRSAPATATVPGVELSTTLRHTFGRDWLSAWLFLLPCLVVMVGLIAYPFVSAILISFHGSAQQQLGAFASPLQVPVSPAADAAASFGRDPRPTLGQDRRRWRVKRAR